MNTPNSTLKREEAEATELPAETKQQSSESRLASVYWVPCKVSVEIPAVRFTIQDLLKLSSGTIVESACRQNSEIPVHVNGQPVATADIETVGDHLAFRISEIL